MLPLLHVTPCPWRGASLEKECGVGEEETRVCLASTVPRHGSHPWTALGWCSGRDGSAGAWCYDSRDTKLLVVGGPVSLPCGQPKQEQWWRPLGWEILPAPFLESSCLRGGAAPETVLYALWPSQVGREGSADLSGGAWVCVGWPLPLCPCVS